MLSEERQVSLSPEEQKELSRKSRQGVVRVLLAQALAAFVAIALAGAVAGWPAALSALIGAAAYFVPNALFAMRLLASFAGLVRSSAYSFFWGEAFKLVGALAILGVATLLGRHFIVWSALLLGLFAVLKGYVLLLFARKLP